MALGVSAPAHRTPIPRTGLGRRGLLSQAALQAKAKYLGRRFPPQWLELVFCFVAFQKGNAAEKKPLSSSPANTGRCRKPQPQTGHSADTNWSCRVHPKEYTYGTNLCTRGRIPRDTPTVQTSALKAHEIVWKSKDYKEPEDQAICCNLFS